MKQEVSRIQGSSHGGHESGRQGARCVIIENEEILVYVLLLLKTGSRRSRLARIEESRRSEMSALRDS